MTPFAGSAGVGVDMDFTGWGPVRVDLSKPYLKEDYDVGASLI